MAYLSTQETSAIEAAKQFALEMKKGRQERRGDWAFDEVMFFFCFLGRYSLVFIDERHQLELNFLV